MREIKFRAWDKNKKEFLKEDYGFWILGNGSIWYRESWNNRKLATHLEIQQYTGLKDKNNKEIYEGDAYFVWFCDVSQKDFNGVIEYSTIQGCYGLRNLDKSHNIFLPFNDKHFTINGFSMNKKLGNIYENPELLK